MKTFHDKESNQINVLDERFYLSHKLKDTYYPSVTTVLNAFPKGHGYIEWLKQVGFNAETIVQKAGEQGSKIHDAIDQFLKGSELRWADDEGNHYYTLEEWGMICKFMDFWNTHEPELIQGELECVSDELQLGGTIDLICKIEGELWLIDFKSSNYIYKSHYLQISAYAEMWNEKFPEKIQRTGILHLKGLTKGADKTGKKIQGKGWQLKEEGRSQEELFKIFRATHYLWKEENPNYRPKNLEYPDRFKLKKF